MNEIDDEFDDFLEDDGEYCPVIPAVFAALSMPRPFGMQWDDDLIEKFLESRGYVFIPGKNTNGDEIKVAVKRDEVQIPELTHCNVLDVFAREIQEVLVDWLINVGKKNG